MTNSPPRFVARLAASIGLMAILAACETLTGPPSELIVKCPETGILAEAERLERYRAGDERDITDLTLRARIGGLRNVCSYHLEDRLLTMDLALAVSAERGPAGTVGATDELAYFLAIVDDEERVLMRENYPLAVTFSGTARQAAFQEALTVNLPVPAGKKVNDFRIYLGLQLSRAELDRVYAERAQR